MNRESRFGVTLFAGTAAVLGAHSTSVAGLIDFEQYTTGEEIGGAIAPGVTLGIVNYNGELNMGVAWDANGFLHKPKVRGSQTPWLAGNLQGGYDPGQGLMIQGIGSVIPRPEGKRAAGEYLFSFDMELDSFGFDFFDIDGEKEFVSPNGYFVSFFSGDDMVGGITFTDLITPGGTFYDASYGFGEASANRLATVTAAQVGGTFDRVRINQGGSGFIDNVRYSVVPTPASAALVLPMLGGMLLRRRQG